ncbi:hypothetical protein GF352_02375 [archaeon]|nr:hypothetical protein [archaeon]
MTKKIIKDAKEAAVATDKLLRDIMTFVDRNIVKVDVKIKEGPLLKKSRKMLAEGLRKIAKRVEDPTAEIKWVDIKKPKSKKK